MLILPYLHKVGQHSKCPHDLGRSSQKPFETVGRASGHPQFCLILGGERSNQLKLCFLCEEGAFRACFIINRQRKRKTGREKETGKDTMSKRKEKERCVLEVR